MQAVSNQWSNVSSSLVAGVKNFPSQLPSIAKTAAVALGILKWSVLIVATAAVIIVPVALIFPNHPLIELLRKEFCSIFNEETLDESNVNFTLTAGAFADSSSMPDVNVPLVPRPEKITVGCESTGNSCWLSSALNLIAGTTCFEGLLSATFAPEHADESKETRHLREFVAYLKLAVNNLRSGIPVDKPLVKALLNKIADADYIDLLERQPNPIEGAPATFIRKPNNVFNQNDPVELLDSLLIQWHKYSQLPGVKFPAPERPNMKVDYKPIGDHGYTKTVPGSSQSIIRPSITIEEGDTSALNLDDLISEAPWEGTFQSLDGQADEKIEAEFERSSYFDPNNKSAVIALKRLSADPFSGTPRYIPNRVDISRKGTVSLGGATYKVTGAFVHHGGAGGGHWFYIEVNRKHNKCYSHNDDRVSADCVGLNALRSGTIFFVEKI